MRVVPVEKDRLAAYVKRQVGNLFPLGNEEGFSLVDQYLPEALTRLARCIDSVVMWKPGQFDVLHSTQYCIFLYYLANTIWRHEQDRPLCTKLFLLNKALNAIDCFYEVELPEVFFIGHSVGIVLAKATYGNHLVLYQNSTVGKNNGIAPIIEDDVILYPSTAVIGDSYIRQGSVLSQGVSVINQETQAGMVVYRGPGRELRFKPPSRRFLADFFRDVG